MLSLSQPYDGPFAVVEACLKFFTVNIGGRGETSSVNQLKPHMGPSPPSPAIPPCRGHPPMAGISALAAPSSGSRPQLGEEFSSDSNA